MLRKASLVLVLLAAVLSGCQGQDQAGAHKHTQVSSSTRQQGEGAGSPAEAAFRKDMALDDIKRVEYRGVDGQALTFEQFIAAAQAGLPFSKTVDPAKSLAVLAITKKDAAVSSSSGGAATTRLNFRAGMELPVLKHHDLGGHLNVLANGRQYTLLSFFFADCVPCIQEVPALNSLAGRGANPRVVSITFDDRDTASKFASRRGLKTSIIPDARDYIDAVGVKVYPTLVLVSPEGRVVGIRSSYAVSSDHGSALANLEAWLGSLGLKT